MKKSALLAGAVVMAQPGGAGEPLAPKPREKGEGKPIPAIGTMRKEASPAQIKTHHKLKMDLKRQARSARYEQHLQTKGAPARE